MQRATFLSLLLTAPWAFSQAPPTPVPKKKVLLMTGGHGFERLPLLALFLANPAIELTEAAHEKDSATAWEREDLLSYDVIVLYDMMKEITPAQQARFAAVRARGIGLVVLHHALCAYQHWAEYEEIIGGRYPISDAQGSAPTEAVGYLHDVDFPVQILAPEHPTTAGLKEFPMHDEIYWGFRVSPAATPLLGTTHAKSGHVLAWTKQADQSKLVYLQLGHGPSAWADANYRQFLAQSIAWVAQ